MNIHRPGIAEIIKAPDLVQQLIAGVHPIGGGGQIVQQLHLLGGRVHLFAVYGQFKGIHIDDQLVKHQASGFLFRGGAGAAAQHGLNPGQHLFHFKGLGDVVIGAVLQAGNLIVGFTLGGEHDDGGLAFGPDGPADRPAVHDRHHHIQQHQVRLDGPVFRKALSSVTGNGNGIALFFQIHLQKLRDIAVVLYNQNRHSHNESSPSWLPGTPGNRIFYILPIIAQNSRFA